MRVEEAKVGVLGALPLSYTGLFFVSECVANAGVRSPGVCVCVVFGDVSFEVRH